MLEIRRADAKDAEAISRAVVRALRLTNAADYPPHIIDTVAENFAPTQVLAQITARQAFVATIDGHVVGTASLDGQVIRSVYVDPDHQGRGVGAKLMDAVEHSWRGINSSAHSLSHHRSPHKASTKGGDLRWFARNCTATSVRSS